MFFVSELVYHTPGFKTYMPNGQTITVLVPMTAGHYDILINS